MLATSTSLLASALQAEQLFRFHCIITPRDAMNAQALLDIIPTIDLFHGLGPAQIDWVSRRLHHKLFPAGSNIITDQQPGEVVYIVLEGTLRVHLEQMDGTDVILAIIGPGDIVGEMSLIDHNSRSANVTTQEETSLLWMDNASFQECLSLHPQVTLNLARILSKRVRMANEQIQSLASLDVYGRVARQLVAFGDRYGRPVEDGTLIPIHLTQSDLADLVGASRKRVNQVIVAFKQLDYIGVNARGQIILRNIAALRRAFQAG